jgi:hypothetical protein
MNLHPKILAALLAAFAGAAVTIVNAFANVYPDNTMTQLLALVLPVLVGYMKRAETKLENESEAATTKPAA